MAEDIIKRAPATQREAIEANISLLTADVRESVQAVADRRADAALSWCSAVTMIDSERLVALKIPPNLQVIFEIWVAVPTYSTRQREARALAEFVAGPAGQRILDEYGFEPMTE